MKLSKQFPLNALRVFEAVARLGSFTKAGEELGMTQTAVSYQVKLLEENIGEPLFLRRPRQIEPDGCRGAAGAEGDGGLCDAAVRRWHRSAAMPKTRCSSIRRRPSPRNGWRATSVRFSSSIRLSLSG